MVIAGPDFRLTPTSPDSLFFDLELLYIVKPKNGEPRQEFKNVAYGVTLETALKKVINYRLSCKYPNKKVISVKQYLLFFRELNKKLHEYVSGETE